MERTLTIVLGLGLVSLVISVVTLSALKIEAAPAASPTRYQVMTLPDHGVTTQALNLQADQGWKLQDITCYSADRVSVGSYCVLVWVK
jgi:hypothetical protein